MLRQFTCIMCPMGCSLEAEVLPEGQVEKVTGNNCKKSAVYAKVRKRQRNVCFTSAVACLKTGGHSDFFMVGRGQAKHDLSYGNEYVRILTRIFYFHNCLL